MPERHGTPPRGLMATNRSPQFEGLFGRMFRSLPPAFNPSDERVKDKLAQLGEAMSANFDPPKDGPDEEESGIPTLYTYLGQFVDHDITFDPASSLQKENDPDALTDFRTPALDLDNVYGRGPDDQPYLYEADGRSFLLGNELHGGGPGARDLPRNRNGRALIGDARNDENTIVSQLHGLVLRFHNRFAAEHEEMPFAEIQREVRFHYQYVVVNDFLPRIVHSTVIADLQTGGRWDFERLRFFRWRHAPFMPVEFSVAAYRLGHSMVRPGYRLNGDVLLPIFPVPAQGFDDGLTGFREMPAERGIDWGRFIDTDIRGYDGDDAVRRNRLQFAYRIDTSLVNPLHELPPEVAKDPNVLAARNLERGWRLGLPSGQAVARRMRVQPLRDDQIHIGKALDGGDPEAREIAAIAGGFFRGRCPLWTYILAEAMMHQEAVQAPVGGKDVSIKTPKLGPVGGRIVAEVFLGLLHGDPHSYSRLNPDWCPAAGREFRLRDFVNYALGL